MKGIMYDLKMSTIIRTKLRLPWTNPLIKYKDNWPRPAIQYPNQVLVRTLLGGICASDLHQIGLRISYFASIFANPTIPFPMGHELIGEVDQVGEAVTTLHPGNRVIYCPISACEAYGFQTCASCQRGNPQNCQCLVGLGDGTKLEEQYGGPGHFGGFGGGGFCEYSVGFENQYFQVPDRISDEVGILTEPFAVGLHAVSRNLPTDDDVVLVIGGGIIGLMTIAAIRALGSQCRIIALVRYPFQGEAATLLGSDVVVNERSSERIYEAVAETTGAHLLKPILGKKATFGGTGPSMVFDCVASENSMDDALHLIRSNGKIVVVGLGYTKTRKIDWSIQVYKEIEIIGAFTYGMEPYDGKRVHAFELALLLMKRNGELFENLLTHRFPIDNYEAALSCAKHKGANQATKIAFDFR
jgi:threonine dehydrogenase-like Zn-dependent dehydrogenase